MSTLVSLNCMFYICSNTILIVTSCAGGRHNMPRPLQVDLWPLDLESGVRFACDVGYLCANFSLPRPLCSRLGPDVRDRQTSDAHRRLMPPTLGAGHNNDDDDDNDDDEPAYSTVLLLSAATTCLSNGKFFWRLQVELRWKHADFCTGALRVFSTVQWRHLPVMWPFGWRGGRQLTRIFVTSSSDRVTVTSRGAEIGAEMSKANVRFHQFRLTEYSWSILQWNKKLSWCLQQARRV